MLKSNLGTVEVEGTRIELMADLSTAVRAFIKNDILDKDDIMECVNLAFDYKDEKVDKERIIKLLDELKEELGGTF